jgi:hypothetical protein
MYGAEPSSVIVTGEVTSSTEEILNAAFES